jgi:hypothetical protein
MHKGAFSHFHFQFSFSNSLTLIFFYIDFLKFRKKETPLHEGERCKIGFPLSLAEIVEKYNLQD